MAEAEAGDDARARDLHRQRAGRGRKRNAAGCRRRQAEHHLEKERQQKDQRSGAGAEGRTAVDTGAKGSDAKHRQIEHRMFGAVQVPERQRPDGEAEHQQSGRNRHLAAAASQRLDAVHDAGQRGAGEEEPRPIERPRCVFLRVVEEQRHQHDAENAERNVDQKDPAPGKIGGDEAADRRAKHGAELRRHLQISHDADQRRLVDAAEQAPAGRPAPSWRRRDLAAPAPRSARRHCWQGRRAWSRA